MSNSGNVEVYELWMDAIQPFSDIEYQRRVWFRYEGPEVDSYEDSIEFILDTAEINVNSIPKHFDPVTCSWIKELVSKIDQYRHTPSYLNGASEKELLGDPEWLTIVQLAQKVYSGLINYRKEAFDAEKRS